MKFLLLAAVALAQVRRPTYGREDGQTHRTAGRTATRQRGQARFGRFGGRTDVNRRDQRYGQNHRVGRYGGYTRQYNQNANNGRGGFTGRVDTHRADPNDNRRGYNPYRNHQGHTAGNPDRLGTVCSQLTAQTAERECNTYTGRQGCEATCARLRDQAGNYNRFHRRGRTTRGRTTRGRTTGRTQTRRNPFQRRTTGGTQTRRNPFQRRTTGRTGTQTRRNPFQRRTTGGTTRHTRVRIPTQGGVFGRRTRGTTGTTRRTYGRTTRGRGQNGFLGNRLGREGHNRQTYGRARTQPQQ